MEKFSLTDIRKKNYEDIYHLIYREERISKSQIANTLQMSLPTVTQHLAALTESGLIRKSGQMTSSIGRKAAAYEINPLARIAIGAEVLTERVTLVVLNLYGKTILKKEVPLRFSRENHYFTMLAEQLKLLSEEAGATPEQVIGAGIGLQGLVSEDGREILYGKILDCSGLSIDRLEGLLPYPCRFMHDAECAAALELWCDPGCMDALYLSLGLHLGGAIISDGQIKSGRNATFEHMTLVDGGKACYCGKHGCMECYCSAKALLTGGGSGSDGGSGSVKETLDAFFTALRRGETQHMARWTEYLHWLALAVNNLHMVIDSPVILGGHIAPFLIPEDLESLFALIKQRSTFPPEENFLRIGVQDPSAVASGAAVPYLAAFIASVGE